MKVLIEATLPHEPFNTLVRQGVVGKKIESILAALKPEVVYFCDNDGKRAAVMVVELTDASQIPALAEPWFLTFNADLRWRVVMTPADLGKSGLDALGKKWA